MLGINTLVDNQFIAKSNRYLSKSIGREKLARLGQYCCKFIYLYTGSVQYKHLQEHFTFLFKCFGLGKPLNSSYQIVAFEKSIKVISFSSWLILLRLYSLFLWQLLDQYNILRLLNVVNTKSFPKAEKIPQLTNYFWLSTLFWSLLLEVKQLIFSHMEILRNKSLLQSKKLKKNAILLKSIQDETKVKLFRREKSFRKIVAIILDGIVVLKLSKLIEEYDLLIAFFGIITSFWGIEDVWATC